MEKNKVIVDKVHDLITRMSDRIGARIPYSDYPKIRIIKENRPSYNSVTNEILLNEKNLDSGHILGEEIGQFIRVYIKQGLKEQEKQRIETYPWYKKLFGIKQKENPWLYDKEEIQPEEFFGYLGRRLLQEIATNEDNLKFRKDIYSRKIAMNELKQAKVNIREYKKDPNKKTDIENEEDYRKQILHHQRPYEFAESLDFEHIQDWGNIFSLSDEEIKKRFFRKDPQYNLKKPPTKAKITKRNRTSLETLVKFMLPGLLLVLLISILSNPSTTGYAILIESDKIILSSITIIALTIIIITSYIVLKNKNKK